MTDKLDKYNQWGLLQRRSNLGINILIINVVMTKFLTNTINLKFNRTFISSVYIFIYFIIQYLFLQKRVPHISGLVKEESIPKAAQLPHETLSTILLCLQACVGYVSQYIYNCVL